MGTRSMNSVASLKVRSFPRLRTACHHAPFEQPPRSAERQDQAVSLSGGGRENRIHISKPALGRRSFPQSIDREKR
eukprot:4528067-Pleurochrysis_carterae.AAC.1